MTTPIRVKDQVEILIQKADKALKGSSEALKEFRERWYENVIAPGMGSTLANDVYKYFLDNPVKGFDSKKAAQRLEDLHQALKAKYPLESRVYQFKEGELIPWRKIGLAGLACSVAYYSKAVFSAAAERIEESCAFSSVPNTIRGTLVIIGCATALLYAAAKSGR